MTDIVERLIINGSDMLSIEAAKEIKQLRGALQKLVVYAEVPQEEKRWEAWALHMSAKVARGALPKEIK